MSGSPAALPAHETSPPDLKGYSLSITVEKGNYIKAYANPPVGGGIVSWGLQGRMREEIADGLWLMLEQWIESNRD